MVCCLYPAKVHDILRIEAKRMAFLLSIIGANLVDYDGFRKVSITVQVGRSWMA